MKYINLILYILLLLTLITLFYNKMLKEHFIESVTEMCNTRKKLNLEPCLRDMQGGTGISGERGKDGRKGIIGEFGDKGISGINGLDAKFIGTINFRDNLTNNILGTVNELNRRSADNKITNVKLLRGAMGDNARMNPIIFIDSETKKVISKQYTENWDLKEIIVEIQKGDKGISGKNAICKTPGKRGIKGSKGIKGIKGDIGDKGFVGNDGEVGDVIENPEFDLITTDELCTNNICIDLNTFKGIFDNINNLKKINNKEEEYKKEITNLSNTAIEVPTKCPENIVEQFTNIEIMNCDNYIQDSKYCSKYEEGDKGDDGDKGNTGFTGMKGIKGIRGMNGFNGINGEEIPNIDFIDKNTEILLGKYKSVNKNAKTEKIYLKNGIKGKSAYIPNIIFKYNNKEIAKYDKEITNESNNDIEDIIVHLDNSKGERGEEGADGVCQIGDEGNKGEDGDRGEKGEKGPRGYDGNEGDKGEPGPIDKNPTYNKITANKYCFSDGTLSEICLDDMLLYKLINGIKMKARQCKKCKENYWNDSDNCELYGGKCKECTKCVPGTKTINNCDKHKDTVCENCSLGYVGHECQTKCNPKDGEYPNETREKCDTILSNEYIKDAEKYLKETVPAGWYVLEDDKTKIEECPIGHYCKDGIKNKCSDYDKYQDETGQSTCKKCTEDIKITNTGYFSYDNLESVDEWDIYGKSSLSNKYFRFTNVDGRRSSNSSRNSGGPDPTFKENKIEWQNTDNSEWTYNIIKNPKSYGYATTTQNAHVACDRCTNGKWMTSWGSSNNGNKCTSKGCVCTDKGTYENHRLFKL